VSVLFEKEIKKSKYQFETKEVNFKPNRRSGNKSPNKYDADASTAAMLMVEPIHSKAFSERFGKDIRNQEIEKFKDKNLEVIGILQELAAKKSEIVDKIQHPSMITKVIWL
jgi:hypothetical protein